MCEHCLLEEDVLIPPHEKHFILRDACMETQFLNRVFTAGVEQRRVSSSLGEVKDE